MGKPVGPLCSRRIQTSCSYKHSPGATRLQPSSSLWKPQEKSAGWACASSRNDKARLFWTNTQRLLVRFIWDISCIMLAQRYVHKSSKSAYDSRTDRAVLLHSAPSLLGGLSASAHSPPGPSFQPLWIPELGHSCQCSTPSCPHSHRSSSLSSPSFLSLSSQHQTLLLLTQGSGQALSRVAKPFSFPDLSFPGEKANRQRGRKQKPS